MCGRYFFDLASDELKKYYEQVKPQAESRQIHIGIGERRRDQIDPGIRQNAARVCCPKIRVHNVQIYNVHLFSLLPQPDCKVQRNLGFPASKMSGKNIETHQGVLPFHSSIKMFLIYYYTIERNAFQAPFQEKSAIKQTKTAFYAILLDLVRKTVCFTLF